MSGVVVGVDRSETAHRAAVKAAGLATALGEPLHLVMAVKGGRSQTVRVGAEQFFVDWLSNANGFLQSLKVELGVADTTTAIGGSNPAKAICEEAERIGASVIVVGNRRVQGAKRVLGSIAVAVTHHAPCDVLIAHTNDDESDSTATPIRHSISSATLFRGCSATQLERVEGLGTSISVTAGQELTEQQRLGREFGVLLNGTATVTVDGTKVATLYAGDHFGEMALLESVGGGDPTRCATITADSDLWISVMSIPEFSSLTAQLPEIADRLRATAVQRRTENGHVQSA